MITENNTENDVSSENSEDNYILIDENNINYVFMFNELLGWNRKLAKQRKLNSYLTPNPHLSHIDLNNLRKIKSLPVLKNSSRASEIKSCSISGMGRVVLSNTCAFDTIAFYIYCVILRQQKSITWKMKTYF